MPVIGIPVNNLLKQLDLDISRDDLITNLEQLGCDVEGYTTLKRLKCSFCEYILELTDTEPVPGRCPNCDNQIDDRVKFSELADLEVIKMELLAVRPDMFDVGGLSRALRGYLGYDKGIAEYRVSDYSQKVTVDPSVNTSECSRPAIACAVIKNINLDSDLIKSVMKLQDNLHWAMGRNRKHASIGIYDLDKVKGPFNYTSTPREGIKFVPLNGMPNDNYNEVFPQEILDAHPKGIGYAHLLDGFTRVPLLMDSDGKVMSMPPVINSDSTKVTVDTKAFFIDVTGTGDRIVNKVLNILVSSFAELFKNCRIEKVLIKQAKCVNTDRDSKTTPDFTVQKVVFNSEEA
jgi:phenylalanyl-tRNA synthetase beta chain